MASTALVTGGTEGLGLLTAQRLLADGYRMFVCGRNDPGDLDKLEVTRCVIRDPQVVVSMADRLAGKVAMKWILCR